MRHEIHDDRFAGKLHDGAGLEELYAGCRWAEGPVWFGDHDCLYFSDIPNDRLLRYCARGNAVSSFRSPSNFANGMTRDRQGRLVSCEHGTRQVTRTELDGSRTVLADNYEGRRLNSPNDVVVKSDGSVWFTDPTYGIMSDYLGRRGDPEQPVRGVYRIDPGNAAVTLVADDLLQPNGLAFSPDEARLYVADSGASHAPDHPRHVRVFDVSPNGRLRGGSEFAAVEKGNPDGIRVDTDGWLWCSAGDGVQVFDATGKSVGKILVPQPVSNLEFGGPRGNRLFIAATNSLYAIFVNAHGVDRCGMPMGNLF